MQGLDGDDEIKVAEHIQGVVGVGAGSRDSDHPGIRREQIDRIREKCAVRGWQSAGRHETHADMPSYAGTSVAKNPAMKSRLAIVATLGTTQLLAWASAYYLPG